MTLANARSAWKSAGFTGSFTPGAGQNNKVVTGQDQTPGSCLPPTTKVVVTFG